jgi:hypothetical protein
MKLRRVRFTVREMMIAILAVAILLAWIVFWEQIRMNRAREAAQAILAEDTNDPLSSYGSRQEAIVASERVGEKAAMWAEGWPSSHVVVFGIIVAFSVTGLTLAISKAISVESQRIRRAE